MKVAYKVLGVLGFICLLSCQSDENYKASQSQLINNFNQAWNTGELDLLNKTVHPEYFKLE